MPAAKPAALRLLNGRGDGKDSAGREVVVPPHDRTPPEPPLHMHGEARAEWYRVVPGLDKLNILKPEDRATFVAYCETWAAYRLSYDKVYGTGRPTDDEATREGAGTTIYVTVRSADGGSTRKPIVNPEYKVLVESRTTLLKFAREFGLTPSSEGQAFHSTVPVDPSENVPNPFAGSGG
jgi:P27 family predicted phage terminase small subunit